MHEQFENARIEAYLAEVAKQLAVMQVAILPKPLISVPKPRLDEELKEIRQHLMSAVSAHQKNGQSEAEATASALADFGAPEIASANILAAWLIFVKKSGWKTFLQMVGPWTIFAIFQLLFMSPKPADQHIWLGFWVVVVVMYGLMWGIAYSLRIKAQRRLATVLQQG